MARIQTQGVNLIMDSLAETFKAPKTECDACGKISERLQTVELPPQTHKVALCDDCY